MKDTKPRGLGFLPQFATGALARKANSDAAAHGTEMDAPTLLPAGSHENTCPCRAYSSPRATPLLR